MNLTNVMDRPLTRDMLETLMDLHERELLNLEPCDSALVRSLSALIKRGLVTTGTYVNKKNKKIVGVFVTYKGKSYLKNI